MSILKVFNNHFLEFLDDVLHVFPKDRNIKTAKFYIKNVIKVNPSIVVKAWKEYVVNPYLEEINYGNWSFFLQKNYNNDIE